MKIVAVIVISCALNVEGMQTDTNLGRRDAADSNGWLSGSFASKVNLEESSGFSSGGFFTVDALKNLKDSGGMIKDEVRGSARKASMGISAKGGQQFSHEAAFVISEAGALEAAATGVPKSVHSEVKHLNVLHAAKDKDWRQNSLIPREPVDVRQGFAAKPSLLAQANPNIPKVLHFVWLEEPNGVKNPDDVQLYKDCMQSWRDMNPNYMVKIWRKPDIESLVRDHYPWFWKTFASFDRNIKRLDTVRYAIMHHEGGVYADMDIVASTPMDSLLVDVDILMVEGGIGFMASIPDHPLWETYLRAVVNVHALPPIDEKVKTIYNDVICSGGFNLVDIVWRQSFACLPAGEGRLMGAKYKFATSAALGQNHKLSGSWVNRGPEGAMTIPQTGDEAQQAALAWTWARARMYVWPWTWAWRALPIPSGAPSDECEEIQKGFKNACKTSVYDPSAECPSKFFQVTANAGSESVAVATRFLFSLLP